MTTAADASRMCVTTTGETAQKEMIVMDDVEQMDGMEWLIAICVDLDTRADASSASGMVFAEARSKLYRGVTRAHMMVLAVNEFIRNGWLAYLAAVRLVEGRKFNAQEAPAQISEEDRAQMEAEDERRREHEAAVDAFVAERGLHESSTLRLVGLLQLVERTCEPRTE